MDKKAFWTATKKNGFTNRAFVHSWKSASHSFSVSASAVL